MSNPAWRIFIPSGYRPRPGDVADLLVHFHGDPQTVWNNARHANLNTIVVTVNYSGLSSAYSGPFSNSSLFGSLVSEALAKVRLENTISDTLTWDRLGISSFSAGYGAVREILKSPAYRNDIDALLAADSLYATTAGDGTALDSQMVDYKTFASLSANGHKTFLFSHSQVPTYTYESTAETGDELLAHLRISAASVDQDGLGTLNFYRQAHSGNFHLWGATGSNGDAHLEHLRYIGQFLADLPLSKLSDLELRGDFNADGQTTAADYVVWRNNVGHGFVAGDYNLWKANFGTSSAAATTVPEPSTAAATLVGAWLLSARRSRAAIQPRRKSNRRNS